MEENKFLFDGIAEKYDKMRPRYCDELFLDIINYSKVGNGQKAIEIGCGTGQALETFLNRNIKISAVELGKNLADFSLKSINRMMKI